MIKKSFIAQVTIILVVAFLTPSMANAQITSSYGRGFYGEDSGLNYCSFDLTMYSPNSQTTYDNTMPLNFNIAWTTTPMTLGPLLLLNGYYAYSIDDGPFVRIAPTPSTSDHFTSSPYTFLINPSFSYSVDIPNLEKGYHNIVINASLYFNNNYPPTHFFFNITTSPYIFLVGEPTVTPTASPTPTPTPISNYGPTSSPTPTPTVPEFSWLMMLPLCLSLLSIVVLIKKRKVRDSL
jgi:hypothetical protein